MAWSPQARKAAALARKRKGHTTSARHIGAKYTIKAKHPGNHSQFKSKSKPGAKVKVIGHGVSKVASATAAEFKAKQAYGKANYKQPGGFAKIARDRYHSTGAYSKNYRGKPYGKTGKAVNKAATVATYANPGNAAALLISRNRGKRKAKKK